MQIAVDTTSFTRRKTGNETYLRGVLSHLGPLLRDGESVTAICHPGGECDYPGVEWHVIPESGFIRRNLIDIPRALKALGVDLYHATYWTRFWAQPVPSTVIVHDVSFCAIPEGYRTWERHFYRWAVRHSARAAEHVVTVSEFSRGEIERYFSLSADRVSVTYNAPPPASTAASAEPRNRDLLYVGNLHPRKNVVRLIQAFEQLKASGVDCGKLIIVGQATWLSEPTLEAARSSAVAAEIELRGYVSNEELNTLYDACGLFVYPSLYEGFGLPVVEAMQRGLAVVTSNTTSLAEVAGDGALCVDPGSVAAIADGVARVLTDEALRDALVSKGRARARSFTWEAAARTTADIWREIVGRRAGTC